MGDSRKYPYCTMGSIYEIRGRRGVCWTGILKACGGYAVWNYKHLGGGGVSALNFQREKMAKSLFENH